jgi:formate hydrogenlyase subunit 3/multisubunit Na+/H+ antiporter MnhD subunit
MALTAGLALAAVALASASGLLGVALRRRPVLGQRLSCAALCAAAALGVAAAAEVLAGGGGFSLHLPWRQPLASLAFRLDPLSAVFLVPTLAVPALGSVYGLAYWPQEAHGARALRLQLFYGLLTGAMSIVVLADNALLFLFGWEAMAVCGFALVLSEPDREEARRASWVYLAAAHVGAFALFAFFSVVGGERGSFDFDAWRGLPAAGAAAGWLYGLLLVGFGLKAGLVPLHFWLPGAHAAAPSHVSAVMSGVLLKTGIYGLLRTTGLFEAPPASWGLALLALGALTAALGVVLALAQHDLKRLLAYHSVENVGIIAMGVGLALLGRARGEPVLVVLGFAGAALHVANHAVFKSLLFLGAGAVVHATGTREVERLGGLARAMPWTTRLFLVGAAAISGLPPLNGFVSEWLVAMGALGALDLPRGDRAAFAVLAVPALALVGALAAACFAKVVGTVFLGPARSAEAAGAHEAPRAMLLPMSALAAACLAIGVAPGLLLPALVRGAASWSGLPASSLGPAAAAAAASARGVSLGAAVLLSVLAILLAVRRRLAAARAPAPRAETWGCGYARPSARMAYTASSFAQILVQGFAFAVLPRVELVPPRGPFPRAARFGTSVPEAVLDLLLLPAVRAYGRAASWTRGRLAGRIHFYAVLVLATLVAMLAWRLLWW